MSQGLSRREFVIGAASSVATVACAISVRGAYLGPTSAPAGVKAGGFDAGAIADLKDGVTDTLVSTRQILIVKTDGKVVAMTSTCLHEKGNLKRGDANDIACTKHAGHFDLSGKPTAGPPTKRHANDHLTRYGVSLKDGHLWVDKSKTFTKDADFEKDGAFVKVG